MCNFSLDCAHHFGVLCIPINFTRCGCVCVCVCVCVCAYVCVRMCVCTHTYNYTHPVYCFALLLEENSWMYRIHGLLTVHRITHTIRYEMHTSNIFKIATIESAFKITTSIFYNLFLRLLFQWLLPVTSLPSSAAATSLLLVYLCMYHPTATYKLINAFHESTYIGSTKA